MNNLVRSTARCLRAGTAGFLSKQVARPAWSSSGRFLCAAADLQKDLGEMVKKDKVVVFMKGTPAQPMCGFSNAVVQILRMHGVDDYAAYNVLEDQDLRQGQEITHITRNCGDRQQQVVKVFTRNFYSSYEGFLVFHYI